MKGLLQFITARAGSSDTPQLLIYGDIGDMGYSGTVLAKDVVEQLEATKPKNLLVRINSYGGRVDEGLAICTALLNCGANITTRIEGVAASIAADIALCGRTIQMGSQSLLMIHGAHGGVHGSSQEIADYAEVVRKMDRQRAERYAAVSGRSVDQEFALLSQKGDRWFTTEEALAAGYVHEVHEPEPHETQQTAYCDGLQHYLPSAGEYAGVITAHLKAARSTPIPAAPAAPAPPETHTMFKTLARLLGLGQISDEAAARKALIAHLKLADAATDVEIDAAVTATLESQPAADGGGQPGAGGSNPAASGAPSREDQVRNLFALAMDGRPASTALTDMRARALVSTESVEKVRETLLAHLAGGEPLTGHANASMQITDDQRDKNRTAATNWLLARSGVLTDKAAVTARQGNPYLGMNTQDVARSCLEDAGINTRRMNRNDLITAAITTSTSDFPNIFENALHKSLVAGYELQKPKWPMFCDVGSLSDFRPHIRYNMGGVGDLEERLQNGEYRTLNLSDAERQTIQAIARGGILTITREMLINDDMGVFKKIAMWLGGASARTLDKAVFALFGLNSGGGPLMGDGKTLFHADHGNIAATAASPTVTSVEAMRVQMASQKAPGGEADDFIDATPEIWLGPLSLGGQARVVNNSTNDPDAENKLGRDNIVANLFSQIVDTPRLGGNAWYGLANPNVFPVIEVGFLDGVQTPQIEQKEAWSQAGMSWRVLFDFAVAATGYRGIVKNPGVAPS